MNRLGNLWPTQRLLIGLIRLIHLLILNPFRAGVINYENGSSWCSQTGGRCQDKEDEIQEESKADIFVSEAKRCLKQTPINFCIESTLYKDQVLLCFLFLGMQQAAYTK